MAEAPKTTTLAMDDLAKKTQDTKISWADAKDDDADGTSTSSSPRNIQ
jgi:hypothetical protein